MKNGSAGKGAYVHAKQPIPDAEIRRIVSEAGYSALTIEELAQ